MFFIIFFLRGIDINGNTVGLAFIGTMCNRLAAIGFTQDGGRSLADTISTAAHELGHIFNMNHDEGMLGCSNCIMKCLSVCLSDRWAGTWQACEPVCWLSLQVVTVFVRTHNV